MEKVFAIALVIAAILFFIGFIVPAIVYLWENMIISIVDSYREIKKKFKEDKYD